MQSLILHAWENGIQTTRPLMSVSGQLMHVEEIPAERPEHEGTLSDIPYILYIVSVCLYHHVQGLI